MNLQNQTWFILLMIIAIFGLIVLGVILFKKFVLNKRNDLIKKEEVKIDEKKAVEEELNRILEPVEDDEIKEQMENFNENKGNESK